ncbi:MAG: VOC family protein [Hyphomicrobiales bacterium]|nr:VOC family protein [Hyphomicrobiales bacterium]
MTEIKGHIKAKRRPGELGVHSLDHFHFVVPDLTAAEAFYSEFGLETLRKGNALALGTRGLSHTWGVVGEGARKRHRYLSFGAFEDDIDRFARRLQEMGIPRLDPPAGVESNGLWLHDHDGNLVEIAVAPKTSPNEKSAFGNQSVGPGERGAPSRSAAARTYPRRLAHVLMFTGDVMKAIDFYTRVLGMRLSDHSGEGIAFLHGIHGSDHHMVAFAKSNAPGFHHLSWDVGSVDEIGAGAMHMLGKGYDRGWGLGRHVLGSNYFHYVRDPWGSYAEYSAGIDYVPADCDWKSGDHPPEDSFYVWGPNPPEDFVRNYEA